MSLYFVGQRSLWQKLTKPGVIRKLSLATDFPAGPARSRILLSLPHLKTIDLVLTNTSMRTQELLAHTSPKLDNIAIHWSPEHYDRRWPGWSPHCLPRSLLEFRSNLPIYDRDFAHLPRTLTVLELTRQGSVESDGFRDLPPLLRHLRLFTTSEHLDKIKRNLCYLPPTITSLELPYLSHVDTKFVQSLPFTLLALNLSRVHILSDSQLALLPRALTHLNIKAASSITNDSLRNLPPNLTFLCIQRMNEISPGYLNKHNHGFIHNNNHTHNNSDSLIAEAIKLLPNSITSYSELPRALQREYTRLYLKRSLDGENYNNHSIPRWVSSNLTDELVALLPPDLQTLDLRDNQYITEHSILKVPSGLRRLYLPRRGVAGGETEENPLIKLPGVLFKYLPRELRELDLPHVGELQDEHLQTLPPNLTKFKLCVDAQKSPISGKSLRFLPSTLTQLEVPFCFLQDIDINTILFKLPSTCKKITFGSGPGLVSLERENTSFLRDTLKHRYLTPQAISWVFDELLRPVASILGLVLVTHLLFTTKSFTYIPFAIAFVPTICSSILFVLQRFLDPDTSLFSWRPSTSIIVPQLIVFICYTILYWFYEKRRPFTPW